MSDDPSGDRDTLIEAVKSAILDRLFAELKAESPFATPRSAYTKSDSGLYGKYEKAEMVNEEMLRHIEIVLADLVNGIEPEPKEEEEPRG